MFRFVAFVVVALAVPSALQGRGVLLPAERGVPPLAMVSHRVMVAIEDQLAVTRVEQTFRNNTQRALEATYVFPVPRGAAVNRFTMWVDGKETTGELVEAKKAREIYTDIVRRTQDPGLLEFLDNDLLRMRVFPVPAGGDQKVAVRFSAVARRDGNLVEYVYPLRTAGKASDTLEAFSIAVTIRSQHGVSNVYSPTHAISLTRTNDQEVIVHFDQDQALLDKDFQLFYAVSDKDVALTALAHRPVTTENGYCSLLIAPKIGIAKDYHIPRDMVLVLDTSGSMRGAKMEQARKALKVCLDKLAPGDRFGLINFATTVNSYRDVLTDAVPEQRALAKTWVDTLEATGGTAIADALASALEMRGPEAGRTFTIVFFTDGQPTIGETNPDKILKATAAANTANTRIFTFGVGDDVNATMLDQLSEMSRAVSTYVRPAEDIEVKVGSLGEKISQPVLTNLKLSVGNGIQWSEVYPSQLPDLFHGSQLMVFGRYSGKGKAVVKLTGTVGTEIKEFIYDLEFPEKTGAERNFVEHLWARRKVGFMLDQIRANGEKKELVDEVVMLAKKYGITTPYTSYLIVPDGPVPIVRPLPGPRPRPVPLDRAGGLPQALAPAKRDGAAVKVREFVRQADAVPGGLAGQRSALAERELARGDAKGEASKVLQEAKDKKSAYDQARGALRRGDRETVQTGKLGVDLSVQMQNLRNQTRIEPTALKTVQDRKLMELGGVWIDEGFQAQQSTVVIKAQSDAYFRLLERKPQLRDVFCVGNHLVWVTPSNKALIVDTSEGREALTDGEIDELFVAAR